MTETVILSAVSALLAAALTAVSRGRRREAREAADRNAELEKENAVLKSKLADSERRGRETAENAEKSFARQIETVRAQLCEETERLLRQREEELSKTAKASFETMAGEFNRNLTEMKTSFEANRKSQNETAAELRTRMDEAVRSIGEKTASVGEKADRLAGALRGQNKIQGCWGETQLGNLLAAEGLTEGRDYDRECVIRDGDGSAVRNEDTGKTMRPDFILHYPDGTDIVIDCKMSLAALSDHLEAETPEQREDAARRNLEAMRRHIDCLARKSYGACPAGGRRRLEYTVMYVPNANALVLARQSDPSILADAFRRNVLVTTEETLMPFLRLVAAAWRNYEQARNQERIIAAAARMNDRVAKFCETYAVIGKRLREATEAFDDGELKLRATGQGILQAAHTVARLGVKGKKELPEMLGEEKDGEEGEDEEQN